MNSHRFIHKTLSFFFHLFLSEVLEHRFFHSSVRAGELETLTLSAHVRRL